MSDIENWELSTARVEYNGQMISFLPDTVRNSDGSLTVELGEYFPKVELVLKRTVFDGMKQEEEEITIEVEIRRLMEKTLATAGKPDYDADANIAEWQELGSRAKATGEDKYRFADVIDWNSSYHLGPIVTESLISLEDTSPYAFGDGSGITEWRSDLPCLQTVAINSPFQSGPIQVFDAKLPNLVDGTGMFSRCSSLTSFNSEMPSLTNAHYMFFYCSSLTSFNSEMPSLTDASSMFEGCSSLTSFQSDMPSSLTTNAPYMFSGCQLDITSVGRISRTIANCSASAGSYYATIHLGVSSQCRGDSRFDGYIQTMKQKGWTIVVNGSPV